jgi:hypothetical protein
VALPDALRETTIRRFKKLCEAAAATTSASSQKLSWRSDDHERARLHAFFALAAGYTCQSNCQPVSPSGRERS